MQILPHKKGKVNSHSDIWEKSINKDWQEVCRSTALHHQPVTPHSLPDGHLLPDLLQCSLQNLYPIQYIQALCPDRASSIGISAHRWSEC